MPASRKDIEGWYREAEQAGARWLVIKCDEFDYRGGQHDECCYPEALTRADEVLKVMGNGDRTMEVYDLSLSLEEQMAERRAWHPPEGVK